MIIRAIRRADGNAADSVVERAPAMVDLRQIERRNPDLDRARHREGDIAADAELSPVLRSSAAIPTSADLSATR